MTSTKNFLLALATLVGTTIGVGIFGLPYLTAQGGLGTMTFYLVLLSVFIILLQLLYGEIILSVKEKHGFGGYVQHYLGPRWQTLAFGLEYFSITGALIAYLIVGGEFLTNLLAPLWGGSPTLYILIYFAAGALLVYRGAKSIARMELTLLLALIGIVVFLFFRYLPELNLAALPLIQTNNLFLPYGAVLFSLWGATVLPEITEVLGHQRHVLRRIIIWGVIISALTYFLFILTVTGLTGNATTPEALTGLTAILPPALMALLLLFGVITTFTSFVSLAGAAERSLLNDYHWPPVFAWLGACWPPLLLYFLGVKNFLAVIGLVGAVALGLFGVMIFAIYLKNKKLRAESAYHLPAWLLYLFIILLGFGVLSEIITYF